MNKHMSSINADEHRFPIRFHADVVTEHGVPIEIGCIEQRHNYAALTETETPGNARAASAPETGAASTPEFIGMRVTLSGTEFSRAASVRLAVVLITERVAAPEL